MLPTGLKPRPVVGDRAESFELKQIIVSMWGAAWSSGPQ